MTPARRLLFDAYAFDPDTGEITGPGGTRRLQPQPAAVLALLATRSGTLVTRDELQRAVWPGTKVEFDQGINYCIRQIRTALDESADAPRFIETLPRRGYRFLVPVVEEGLPAPQPRRSTVPRALAGATVLALAAVWTLLGPFGPRTGEAAKVRVVVLPFSDPDSAAPLFVDFNRALGDAVVLELTAADQGRLGVVGPLTTDPLLRRGASAAAIGDDLSADYIVSGGARSRDSTVFIQAIRRLDGEHVVAKRFPWGGRTPEAVAAQMVEFALPTLVTDPEGGGTPADDRRGGG